MPSDPLDPAPGAGLVRRASRLVPPERRESWRREWEAEVHWAWRRLCRNGPPSRRAVWRLRLRILSCFIDALWEGRRTMGTTGWWNDVRFALRGLGRHPTFSVIAVMTLALGIGANTAVFTLVDGVLLSPLPFEESDRLVSVQHLGRDGRDELGLSQGLYVLYAEEASSFDGIALQSGGSANVFRAGEPERVPVRYVTPGFFEVLRTEPALGRGFVESEGAPEGEPVVVLSDGLWRAGYGADPGVIGRTLDVDGTTRRIVGVMPPDFGWPDREARLWLPLVVDPVEAPLASFGAAGVARLAPGNTAEGALAELQGLVGRLPELFPESGAVAFLGEVNLRPRIVPLKEALVGDVSSTLWILLGTVGFVLLIACANVANLLLVRAEGRRRELALRAAVGAGRAQIVRAFLAESLVLSAAGGAAGVVLSVAAVRASLRAVPTDLPRVAEIGVDPRVLGFTAVVALGCALFFGLFPLVRSGSDDLAGELRDEGGRGGGGSPDRHRLRNGLVVAQMALALVLLVGSGLMYRSFQALREVDPGFDAEGVLTARVSVPSGEIQGWEETAGFYRQLRDRLAAEPGVEAVGFAQSAPLAGGVGFFSIEVEDHPRAADEIPILTSNNFVEAGYLEALGIDLIEGRTFRSGDGAEGARSVVVTRSFADQWWPDASPLGRRMRLGFEDEEWYHVVGVVEDAHYQNLEEAPEAMVYWPATIGPAAEPQPMRAMDVVVKTAGDPLGFVPVLRREVAAVNPRIPISDPRTMDSLLSDALSRTSFTMSLLGAASLVALLLGLVGIYGVISYVVSQRTREIGVRMALGATGGSVRSMVVRQGLVLAVLGVVLGLAAAGAMSSLMASLLYGVSATDPLTYASVAAGLVAVALLASWIPAMRAAGVDPARALRAE